MTGSDLVKVFAPLLLEATKLDELVAHHIRIGGQSPFHRINRVANHPIPILLMQRDDLKPTTIFTGDVRGNLNILLRRTVDIPILILHSDADIEDGRIITGLFQ